MSNNTAPDSWESQADSMSTNNSPVHNAADVTAAQFSTLNVNAVEFVPSFAKSPVNQDEQNDSPNQSDGSNFSPQHSPILNGKSYNLGWPWTVQT